MKLSQDVLIASRYQIVECLGAGAMGEVWRARDTRFESRTVAVKFLREDETLKEDQLNRDRLTIRLEQHSSRGTLSFETALGSVVAALGASNPEGVRAKLSAAIGQAGAIRPPEILAVFDELVNDPTLNDNARMRAKLRRLFRDEANAVANLRHDNIVSIFDYGDHEGSPYLVMDYIEGRTLYHIIQERQKWKFWRRLQLIEDLCAGLGYAHRHKLVHRDIKPANLIIDGSTGSLKILDFGVVRRLGSASTVGVPVGTFCYMSPEQTKGAATLDHRSDIFAVGLVLYELMTGKKAYPPGKSIGDLVARIQRDPPPDALKIDPTIPEGVQNIINKAVQKLPENRYPDLTIMGRELSRLRTKLEQQEQTDITGIAVSDDSKTILRPRGPQQVAADILAGAQRAFDSGDDRAAAELVGRALDLVPADETALALQRRIDERRLEARVAELLQPAEKFLALEEITSARGALAAAEGLAPGSPTLAAFKAKLDAAASARVATRERTQRERERREEEQRAQQERAREQERLEREQREHEERAREQARLEREQREREERAREQARLEAEHRARLEQERLEREQRESEERERLAAEQKAREEQERREREQREREEQERLAREERERLEKERQEREQRAREQREREERVREQERLAREQKAREERERVEREQREQRERAERERAERDRAAQERAQQEAARRAAQEKEEQARQEQLRLQRQAAEKEAAERQQKEAEQAAHQQRLRDLASAGPLTPGESSEVTLRLSREALQPPPTTPPGLSKSRTPIPPVPQRTSVPAPPLPVVPSPTQPPARPATTTAAVSSTGTTRPKTVGPTRKSRRYTVKPTSSGQVTAAAPTVPAAATAGPSDAAAAPSPTTPAAPVAAPPTRAGVSTQAFVIVAAIVLLLLLATVGLVWMRSTASRTAAEDPPPNAATTDVAPEPPPATPSDSSPETTPAVEPPPSDPPAAASQSTVYIDLRPWARVKIVPSTPNPDVPTEIFYAPFAVDLPPGDYNLEAENGGVTRATTFQLKVAEGGPQTFVRNMPGFNATKIVEGLLGRD